MAHEVHGNSGNSTTTLEEKIEDSSSSSSDDPNVTEHTNDRPRYEKFQISNDGICTSCNKSGNNLPSADIIQCRKCKGDYHALCKSVETSSAICNISLLKLYKQNSTKDNFSWICDSCKTESEITKAATLEQQVATLLGIVKELSEDVKELKKESKTRINSKGSQEQKDTAELGNNCSDHCVTAYSSAVKVPPNKATLLIKGNKGTPVDIEKVKEIVVKNKVPVLSANVTENGDTYINFPSMDNRAKVTSLIKENVATENDVVTMKSKLPSISITGITENLNKSQLLERIRQQNVEISNLIDNGSVFEIIFVKEPSTKYLTYQAVARVSPDIRSIIKSRGNRVYIGLVACRVTDRFYVKRCNTCQCFGHYSSFHGTDLGKENTKVVCGYCSEEHYSNDCPKKTMSHTSHLCSNCTKSGKNGSGHSTFYYRCPAYLAEQNRLKNTIDYYNGSPNLN